MIVDSQLSRATAIQLPWSSVALVWIMLLPTIGMSLVWDRIQRLTGGAWKLFS